MKKMYTYFEEGQLALTLLLSDDQAAVFKWLNDRRGYDINIEPIDTDAPIEIKPERFLSNE